MEKQFVNGVRAFRPRENAPDFIKLNLVFEKDALLMWLESQEVDENGQIKVDLKESKQGKLYLEVNTWKATATPHEKPQNAPEREITPKDGVSTIDDNYPQENSDPDEIPF